MQKENSQIADETSKTSSDISLARQKFNEMREEIEKLKKELSGLKKENTELESKIDDLTTEKTKAKIKEEQLIKSLDESNKEKRHSEKMYRESKIECERQETEIKKLTENITFLQEKTLNSKKDADEKEKIITDLKDKVTELSIKVENEDRKNVIKKEIANILFSNELTIDGLYELLIKKYSEITKESILKYINELSNIYTFESSTLQIPRKFKIIQKEVPKDKALQIKVPEEEKSIDILVISDIHANQFDLDTAKKALDISYNYAAQNSIKMISDLGDLIDIRIPVNQIMTYEQLLQIRLLIKKIEKLIPKDTGINHIILGGNHEQTLCRFGIDTLKELTKERLDIINLGYEYAQIKFIDEKNGEDKGNISLKHPKESFNIKTFNTKDYVSNFKNFNPEKVTSYNSMLTMCGHFHLGKYYPTEKLILAPSITNDRLANGALHLHVNFNTDNQITSIEVLPLILFNDKLLQVSSEIEIKTR